MAGEDAPNETINIHIKNVPKPLYYRLQAIKAKYQLDTWIDFLEKAAPALEGGVQDGH